MTKYNKSVIQKLKGCPDGVSFSECKKILEKKKRRTKKPSRSPSRIKNRKSKTTKKSPKKKIPPKGVIIRKNKKLYKSNGKKFILYKRL